MLDPRLLRNNRDLITKLCSDRRMVSDLSTYNNLEKERKKVQQPLQELQHQRNQLNKVYEKKALNEEKVDDERKELKRLKKQIKEAEKDLKAILKNLEEFYNGLPNLLDESVPIGTDEKDNAEILVWGEKPHFPFKPKEHYELFPRLLDFELAAQMAGSRFALLRGDLALVHRALAQLMLDVHINQHDYEELYVPLLVKEQALKHSGQLPKFSEDLFVIGGRDSFLIPTAEVPLVNIAANRIFAPSELPLKLVAYTPCFRSEAGSYGKDVKGMLRLHQFDKVELVQITKPEDSWNTLEEMSQQVQKILQLLELPYKVVNLCSGDIGFHAAKTYDIEVWLPGQNRYREVSSCSNCTDFQARRMQARWRDEKGNRHLVHTLNASGLAVGRTLIALLENYQTSDGKVILPKALHPYLPERLKQLEAK